MTGNGGGPMSLAETALKWSHVAGRRHSPRRSTDEKGEANYVPMERPVRTRQFRTCPSEQSILGLSC